MDFLERHIIAPAQLPDLRKLYKSKKIVFTSGTFDLLHLPHIFFLGKARDHGDMLIVSVGLDSVIKKNKGSNRPILSQDIRVQTVAAIRTVDYCFLDNEPDNDHPLATLKTNLELLQPDVYAVEDEAFGMGYRRNLLVGTSTRLVTIERSDFLSTTTLIDKIKAL